MKVSDAEAWFSATDAINLIEERTMREKPMNRVNYDECATKAADDSGTVGLRPMNQIEQLQKEVDYWKSKASEAEQECLNLYRRIYAQDKPYNFS